MDARYSADQYASALRNLLPRGRAWSRDSTGVQASVLAGLAKSSEAVDSGAMSLLADAFPATAVFLLPQWEQVLGLPDPCAGISPTLQARQAQAAARFANVGGQTVEFFQAFAQTLGYQVEIVECAPFRMGQSHMGSQLGDHDWSHVWRVISDKGIDLVSFRMGRSGMGEPLESWGSAVLECELNQWKPAHTLIVFELPAGG